MARTNIVIEDELIDCMIASIALRSNASVLTADRDFARIAEVVPLEIDTAPAL